MRLVAVGLVVLGLPACASQPVVSDGGLSSVAFVTGTIDKVDLLFAIDNSASTLSRLEAGHGQFDGA